MSRGELFLTETHHAGISVAFYRALAEVCGASGGLDVFLTAERAYGSRRGRRMALRALRDGNPLDLASYFAYGELTFTDDGTIAKGHRELFDGGVHDCQVDCRWSREFRALGAREFGAVYCREIDASIVRGFNPRMRFEARQNMNMPGCSTCEFYFYGDVGADFLSSYGDRLRPGQVVKRSMAYACADLYDSLCRAVAEVLPDRSVELVEGVREALVARYGEGILGELDSYREADFERIDG